MQPGFGDSPPHLPSFSPELKRTPGYVLKRQGRFAVAELLVPHAVLSTCHVHGGQNDALRFIANHQSCEGSGHAGRDNSLHRLSPADYHAMACAESDLPPAATCLMGTAASMDYAALAEESWEELSVLAWVTGGVKGNAARAGDPAKWHERRGRWVAADGTASNAPDTPEPGTLNALVLFNVPMTPAALVRAAATLAEAKAAVLYELAVPSLQSPHAATGTGTDQFALAAPLIALDGNHTGPERALTWSGHHTKVGELLGLAVMRAFRETLRWQNGLEPSLTRSLAWAGRGFGLTEAVLRQELAAILASRSAEWGALARENFEALLHHPRAAAQVYALRALEERARYGTLPATLMPELRLEHALLLARHMAATGQAQAQPEFEAWRALLAPHAHDPKRLILEALALGFAAKWI